MPRLKVHVKEKIPTPGNYKNREKPQYHIIDGEGYWNSGKVRKVLHEDYVIIYKFGNEFVEIYRVINRYQDIMRIFE